MIQNENLISNDFLSLLNDFEVDIITDYCDTTGILLVNYYIDILVSIWHTNYNSGSILIERTLSSTGGYYCLYSISSTGEPPRPYYWSLSGTDRNAKSAD